MPHFFQAVDRALQELNVFVAAIMVVVIAWGFLRLARFVDAGATAKNSPEVQFSPKIYPGPTSALLCWLMWWLILLGVYSLLPDPSAYRWALLLDGFGNIALLGAATCLLQEDKAPPAWRFAGYLLAGSLSLLSWNLLFGFRLGFDNKGWRMFVSSPGIFLAMGAFIFLAYTSARRFQEFATQIWSVCGVYALLQAPAYYYLLIDSTPNSNGRLLLASLLGTGKIMFVLLFLSILLFEMKLSTKGGGLRVLKYALSVVGLVLSLISIISRLQLLQ